MTNPSKIKGDTAEREIAALVADLTGWPVRRKLGAGRADDTGDLYGIPDCTAQVKNRPTEVMRAIREAIDGLETQRVNAGTTHAVAFVRRPGGRWLAIQTVEQWATSHREATNTFTHVDINALCAEFAGEDDSAASFISPPSERPR